MIGALRRHLDTFLGRGGSSITVPVLDGPLKPNDALETATVLMSLPGIDNLVAAGERVLCSSGADLLAIATDGAGATAGLVVSFAAQISCLASDPSGAVAIGLEGQGLIIDGGAHHGKRIDRIGAHALKCPTAALFLDADTLLVANGSDAFEPSQWTSDLMSLGRSGSVWRINLGTGDTTCLAGALAYPAGLAVAASGSVFVVETWRHRIISVSSNGGRPDVVLQNLPAYPFRIAVAEGGGFWVTMIAIRNQLIEFVLLENEYRTRMMADVDPAHWIAPALSSGSSFEEPLQGGAVKQMGTMKAWAPTRSYGLVVRCDDRMHILESHHSRADGSIHGVTSVLACDGHVLVAAKGPGKLVQLEAQT